MVTSINQSAVQDTGQIKVREYQRGNYNKDNPEN